MSQMITRKGPVGEDKDKRHSDSPAKDVKKKMATHTDKEKQSIEKEKSIDKSNLNDKDKIVSDKPADKKEKVAEKTAEKKEKVIEKSADKKEKAAEKPVDKKEKAAEKAVDKKEKVVDKLTEKTEKSKEKVIVIRVDKVEKKQQPTDKSADKSDKVEKKDTLENKDKAGEKKEAQVPPVERRENGKPESTDTQKADGKPAQNGARLNGDCEATVSSEDEDQMFPELAYEDSDIECFDPATPDGLPSRSYTRRSQVKATRTPETPRPASGKQTDKDYVPDSKETKLLKLKDDTPSSDRKLRSADSPRRQDGSERGGDETGAGRDADRPGVEVTVDVEVEDGGEPGARVKSDTNYSKSRVKVSPYRRSGPGHALDHTLSSAAADYTGNNTTMEMDITEASLVSEEPAAESPYLSGLRNIRGRRSYKPLKEMALRNIGVNTSIRSTASLNLSEHSSRPTGTVVGRKRKPDGAEEAQGKRARLVERLGSLARPFRYTAGSDRLCADVNAQIVGINTDLPLTVPIAADSLDPESGKPASAPALRPVLHQQKDKRCVVM